MFVANILIILASIGFVDLMVQFALGFPEEPCSMSDHDPDECTRDCY